MPDFTVAKLSQIEYIVPTIKAYNRLEIRPRTADFDRSLKAEVRDPLWLLTRQWQYGEFQGEDSATAAYSKFLYEHRTVDRIHFNGQTIPFDAQQLPLETQVEREKVRLTSVRKIDGVEHIYSDLLLAIRMGKHFLKLLTAAGLNTAPYLSAFLGKYRMDVFDKDVDAAQVQSAVVDSVPDACLLYRAILSADPSVSFNQWVDDALIFGADAAAIKTLAQQFADAFTAKINRLFSQPDEKGSAWLPQQLEYQFGVANPPSEGQEVLSAAEYYQGHLDWFAFDKDSKQRLPLSTDSAEVPRQDLEKTDVFMPKPVWFKGMPQPRYWQMEEEKTDFGKINTSPTGLLHLILAEFGLVYSNDWFILPHIMPTNTICDIKGMLVTDVFGQHFYILPANGNAETQWQRWAMFHHSEKGTAWTSRQSFYLTPSVGRLLESEPIERVHFLRDEMSNMVWAVENIVPSQLGKGVSGKEMALREETPDDYVAKEGVKIRYVLGTRVPDNWIPFIAVHTDTALTEIQLQRARMIGSPGAKGVVLTEVEKKYLIHEEEVPRAGVIVERSYQRTRWLNGKTYMWIGRRKEAGRGEGWSGLLFDRIQDVL